MKKILFTLFLGSFVLFTACNKNQKVVKELDGTWSVSAMTVDGVAQPASSYAGTKYTFTECKVKKGDCDGSISSPDSTKGTVSIPFTYSITEKGEKITISLNVFGFVETSTGDIKEHSDSKFVFTSTETDTNASGQVVTSNVETTLTKD